MREDEHPRLFPLRSEGEDFHTGLTQDGHQVVIGLLCPHLSAFFFAADGSYVREEVRLWEYPAPRFREDGPFDTYDEQFRARLSAQLDAWKAEMGFTAAPISVQTFFSTGHWVGIDALPQHLEDEEGMDDEERAETTELREHWVASGSFVFWWAKDYFMNGQGEVEST